MNVSVKAVVGGEGTEYQIVGVEFCCSYMAEVIMNEHRTKNGLVRPRPFNFFVDSQKYKGIRFRAEHGEDGVVGSYCPFCGHKIIVSAED